MPPAFNLSQDQTLQFNLFCGNLLLQSFDLLVSSGLIQRRPWVDRPAEVSRKLSTKLDLDKVQICVSVIGYLELTRIRNNSPHARAEGDSEE
jgi:hypothetical protein